MSERWGVYVSDVADKGVAKAELAALVDGTEQFSGHLYHVVSGEHCMATTGCGPRGRENADTIARLPIMIEALERIRRGPVQPAPDAGAHSWQANASFWRAECLRLMSLARDAMPIPSERTPTLISPALSQSVLGEAPAVSSPTQTAGKGVDHG